MITQKFLSAALVIGLAAMVSCTGSQKSEENNAALKEQQVKQTQFIPADGVELRAMEDVIIAEKGGEPYTGEVWSEDGKTFVMHFKDGEPVKSVTYHPNGKMAINASADIDNQETHYYNVEGEEIPDSVFFERYFDFINDIDPQLQSVFARIIE